MAQKFVDRLQVAARVLEMFSSGSRVSGANRIHCFLHLVFGSRLRFDNIPAQSETLMRELL